MGRNEPTSEEQLLQVERRLLSIFEDRTADQEVMARSERRLRHAMAAAARPARRWRSSVAGVTALMVALFGVAMLTAAVHGGLIHLGTTTSTAKPQPTVTTSIATPAPPLSCRLPVRTDDTHGQYSHGFVNYPDGAYVPDTTVAGRIATYDAPLKRWIPFSMNVAHQAYQALSPDGRTFLYVSGSPVGPGPYHGDTAIHLVDLVGGQGDRVVWKNALDDATILGYSEVGVVFMVNARPAPLGTRVDVDAAALGHWLLNPADGRLTKISMPQGPQPPNMAAGPYLWTTRQPKNQLVRIDLQTGAEQPWHDMREFEPTHGPAGNIIGFDNQYRPIYRFGSRDPGVAYKVVLLSAPDQAVVIYTGHQGDATGFDPTQAIGDAHGIWFGNFFGSAVWLYHAGTLDRVRVNGLPQGSASIIDLAGACS
jgi:hypothetical protein